MTPSIVGLCQGDVVATPYVDQGVPVPTAGAQKEASLAVDLGRDSPEHDPKAAAPALPHGDPPGVSRHRTADMRLVYLVATGEVHHGLETYTRHEGAPPPLCDYETLFGAAPSPDPLTMDEIVNLTQEVGECGATRLHQIGRVTQTIFIDAELEALVRAVENRAAGKA